MENIKISIIVAVFNSELYLRECFDSILKQTFTLPFEVVVSYSISKDRSLDILKEYQSKLANMHIITHQNYGVCLDKMVAIKEAKGEYICILDSDDYLHPDFLKIMYDTIKKGYDIVNCNFCTDRKGKITNNKLISNKEYNSVNSCKHLLLDMSLRSFMCTKIIKRSLFTDYPLYYPKIRKPLFEDTLMLFGIMMNIKKLKMIKNTLYYYRDNSTSLTKTRRSDRFLLHLNTFRFIRFLCEKHNNNEYFKIFKRTFFRSKLSLIFDVYYSKSVLETSPHKYLKKYKNDIKELKNKKPLDYVSKDYYDFILDCLKQE